MKPPIPSVLTINGGSSSIKFAVYQTRPILRRLHGKIDRIGLRGTNLTVSDSAGRSSNPRPVAAGDHHTAAAFLLDWLAAQSGFDSVKAVGHRIVHGLQYSEPQRVT